jgi:hypothetical protein
MPQKLSKTQKTMNLQSFTTSYNFLWLFAAFIAFNGFTAFMEL